MVKKYVTRKSTAQKAKEQRPTLAQLRKIIEDGTITDYSSHTIARVTLLRKKHLKKT